MGLLTDRRIAFFDLLRALAVTLVIVAHYRYGMLPGGSIGVSIFFCLSGFLITTLLLEEKDTSAAVARRFIVRRFMRVYPAYFFILIAMLALMVLTRSPKLSDYVTALPGLLSFTSMPDHWIGMGTGVLWTLHVEFWFYAAMPCIIMACGRGRGLLATVAVFIGLSYVVKVGWVVWQDKAPNLSPLSMLLWADTLFYGAVVAILFHRGQLKMSRAICASLSAVGFLGIIAIARFIPNKDLTVWLVESSVASLLTTIIIASYLARPTTIRLDPVAWFGKISYSVYLVHAIPLDYDFIGTIWPHKGKLFVLLLIVTAIASAMYYLIERPGIRLGRRMTERRASTESGVRQ